ncbi:MAM domain-containing glycosylphosphatidylinositol anchor protein 1 [Geodia barretti]|uniref:MAM domain-containing glycosylphosphatidylinositol anchor protein 1 n=1 Tax=Geodia barretti TaxID=519541 RepID=A0AA35SKJ9_GEOBA|nr:MAM domain-containing glycosylphosphatidylinositol anchor protein 1 [Geodia barretti]
MPIIAPPSVMVRISEDIILVGEDVVVYCDIDLIGVVRGRDVAVEVTWFQEGVPVRPDSRLTISGATGDVGGVHSSLTFSPVHFSDMATYECRVTLTPLLGPASPVSSSDSIFLNISEPVDPVRPEDVTFREVQSDSVTVQWRVSHISYSPETYVVQYGTSRESLIHNSSRTHSEEGVMTYSVQLSGLRDNTTYYVQVLATNTALRSSRSSVESFTILVTSQMTTGQPASCQTESNESASIVGGILSLVVILIIGVSILGFVILILKIRTLKLMLEKPGVREGGEVESKSVPTATNAAYGVVSHDQSSSGDVAMYEIVGQPPSSSARPTAHPPSDYPHSSQGPPLTDSPYDVIANQ